jgi:DNA-binding MarR family transcriptional regulator
MRLAEVCHLRSGDVAATAAAQRLTAQERSGDPCWTPPPSYGGSWGATQASGVSPADYQVLLALREAEGTRLRSSELAATIDWERSRLSHHLGRMERRGLIQRDDCATDSRGAEVSLTPSGAGAFRRASAPHLRAIKQYL